MELYFYINSELQKSHLFTSSEFFEIELIKPDEFKESESFEVKIQASSVVNPKNSMISEDERDLSCMLFQIEQK